MYRLIWVYAGFCKVIFYSENLISVWASNDRCIALDKPLISTKKYWHFSYFSRKTYVVVLIEAPPRDTSNEYPQHMFSLWTKKKYLFSFSSYLGLCNDHDCIIQWQGFISRKRQFGMVANFNTDIACLSIYVLSRMSGLWSILIIIVFWPVSHNMICHI